MERVEAMRRAYWLAFVIVFGAAPLHGADTKVPLGTRVSWQDLPGVDGRKHSLSDLQDKDVVVIAITCNHCPVALEYYARMKAFVHTAASQGRKVALVAAAVSHLEADKLPRMKQVAARQGFNFPYLYDESQALGRCLGATRTPQFFVLDRERRLVYRGAWDDNNNQAKVRQRYVEDAVTALLAGKQPVRGETEARGCAITYRD
jgi:peroxiredoxin